MKPFPVGKVAFYSAALLIAGVCGVLIGVIVAGKGQNQPAGPRLADFDDEESVSGVIEVNVVQPKQDPTFMRTITGPAYVEPYYQADLFSHVAGPVKYIRKDIGERVTAGELLVEIDVPDLISEIAQKEAVVNQAIADRDAATANVKMMAEAVTTAKTYIPVKEALLDQAEADLEFREAELKRFKQMVIEKAITPDVVDERSKQTKAAAAGCKAAKQAIEAAKSEWLVTQAKLEKAIADLKVMEARIAAVKEDKARTQAKADWAKITAPFNGVITARNVDIGGFVQDATTARTKPMFTIMRLDLVTVAMMVPERAAPFVKKGLDGKGIDVNIRLEVEDKPIRNLRAKVTRFAPFLDAEKGRTKRVEVDIYNPPEHGFKRSLARGVSAYLLPLGSALSLSAPALALAGKQVWGRPGLLDAGMYGTMQLMLDNFDKAVLIPSSAIFSRESKTYVYMVEYDLVKRVEVRVQYEDGVKAKVAIVVGPGNPEMGEEEELQPLKGTEKIIRIGQGELRDGQKVKTILVQW